MTKQEQLDELDLIRAVLDGYPNSMAKSDALRAVRVLKKELERESPASECEVKYT
jgi:hypothetical protein